MKVLKGKLAKILFIILICFIVIGICIASFFIYKYISDKQIKDNINNIYNIYNNDNRQEIIKEYWDDNTIGVPIDAGNEKLNSIATLEIPSIGFKDIVVEGTTQNSLANGIGLFEHSSILDGNVCLAGHNSTRFFSKLKDVKQGDIIKYSSCLGNKEYSIETIKQINENDWSMLEDTKDNRLTIITCVKNQKSLRLCVQAVEKL